MEMEVYSDEVNKLIDVVLDCSEKLNSMNQRLFADDKVSNDKKESIYVNTYELLLSRVSAEVCKFSAEGFKNFVPDVVKRTIADFYKTCESSGFSKEKVNSRVLSEAMSILEQSAPDEAGLERITDR